MNNKRTTKLIWAQKNRVLKGLPSKVPSSMKRARSSKLTPVTRIQSSRNTALTSQLSSLGPLIIYISNSTDFQ